MSTIIIGGGIAGITTAAFLKSFGEECIVLEAADRIGGRIHTDYEIADVPIELGAEFVHGSEAPTWEAIKRCSVRTTISEYRTLVRLKNGLLTSVNEACDLSRDFKESRYWNWPIVETLPNESLMNYLVRVGLRQESVYYVANDYANAFGAKLTDISAESALSQFRQLTTGKLDYILDNGYMDLLTCLSEGLDIRLQEEVIRIEWSHDQVNVLTKNDNDYCAKRVVIAVPVSILKDNRIQFVPTLPVTKQRCLDHIIMEPAVKIVFLFTSQVFPEGINTLLSERIPSHWWLSTFERNSKYSIVSGFASGDQARVILKRGAEFALDNLKHELSNYQLKPDHVIVRNWYQDQFIRGGYSVVLPTMPNARSILAEPCENKLYWVGEGCTINALRGTVHGAYFSARHVAHKIAKELEFE